MTFRTLSQAHRYYAACIMAGEYAVAEEIRQIINAYESRRAA
ncbi:hypothetical protein ABWH97_00030 [Nitratireductor sp. ac15]